MCLYNSRGDRWIAVLNRMWNVRLLLEKGNCAVKGSSGEYRCSRWQNEREDDGGECKANERMWPVTNVTIRELQK